MRVSLSPSQRLYFYTVLLYSSILYYWTFLGRRRPFKRSDDRRKRTKTTNDQPLRPLRLHSLHIGDLSECDTPLNLCEEMHGKEGHSGHQGIWGSYLLNIKTALTLRAVSTSKFVGTIARVGILNWDTTTTILTGK